MASTSDAALRWGLRRHYLLSNRGCTMKQGLTTISRRPNGHFGLVTCHVLGPCETFMHGERTQHEAKGIGNVLIEYLLPAGSDMKRVLLKPHMNTGTIGDNHREATLTGNISQSLVFPIATRAIHGLCYRNEIKIEAPSFHKDLGLRFYRGGGGGGGRGRGRTFHDFDREFGQPGEHKGSEGFTGRARAGPEIEGKDELGGGFDGGGRDSMFRKMDFDDEEEEKPETAEERMLDLKNRERAVLLRKFKTQVIDVNRTFKVTKGGGEINFTALVICGNGDGVAGYAKGKGPKATRAIREASAKALNNLYHFERFKGQTIYHYVEAKYEKTKVRLWPEWTLGVFRAAGIVRGILRLAGIQNIKSKLIGSANPHNTVKATFMALSKVKTPKEYEEKYWRAVVERHLIVDPDGQPSREYRKLNSWVL